MLLYSEVDQKVDNVVAYYLQQTYPFQDIDLYYVDKKTYKKIHKRLTSIVEADEKLVYRLEKILKKKPVMLIIDRDIKDIDENITCGFTSPLLCYDGSLNYYQPFIIISWRELQSYPNPFGALEFFLLHEMGHFFGLVPDGAPNLADEFHHCKHKYCVMYRLNLGNHGHEHMDYIKKVNPNIYCKTDYKVLQKRIRKFK